MGEHLEVALCVAGPFSLWTVPVEFDAVVVGVAEIEGLADAVVGGALELDSGSDEPAQGVGEFGARRIENSHMIKAGRAVGGWPAVFALPGVEADVMMVAAGGEECGLCAVTLGELESKDIAIESEGAIEVGDLQMNVADSDVGMDRFCGRLHDRCKLVSTVGWVK